MIFGTPEPDVEAAPTSGNGSSYVAKGVLNCECIPAKGDGGPGNEDADVPRLCNLAWFPVDEVFTDGVTEFGFDTLSRIFCLELVRGGCMVVSGDMGEAE